MLLVWVSPDGCHGSRATHQKSMNNLLLLVGYRSLAKDMSPRFESGAWCFLGVDSLVSQQNNTCVFAAPCSKVAAEVVDSEDSVLYVMKHIQSCTY